jgi:hypothetical protein
VVTGGGLAYQISGTIVIGTDVIIELGGGSITQTTSNIPIVQVSRAALNRNWSVRNGTLQFSAQQTSAQTGAVGVRLATTNVTSYLGKLENLYISKACYGVDLPELTDCTAFLVSCENVTANDCSSWGFNILGDASGARTNLVLDRCFVLQSAGAEQATSRGFVIKRCQELTVRNCAVDHIQVAPALFLDACFGASIESFACESCDFTASTGQAGYFLFSGSDVSAQVLTAVDNNITLSGDADGYAIRTSDTCVVRVDLLQDMNTTVSDTSSGGYYTTIPAGADILTVESHYTSGATPAASHADFDAVKKLRRFDGSDRTRVEDGHYKVYASAAPSSGAWTVGDVAWNSAMAAGDPLCWVCTASGSPGTWVVGGQVGYRSNAGTPSSVLTPNFIGERVFDSSGTDWYTATGVANTNWKKDSN